MAEGSAPAYGRDEHAVERVQARVNLAGIERNSARLGAELTAGAQLCAVVKANGYGHGAVQSARAALAGGTSWLAVAGAAELRELREAGIDRVPVLVMGALTRDELAETLALGGDVVVWDAGYVAAVSAAGGGRVHVKLDSGMGRLGTRDPEQASAAAHAASRAPGVTLVGLMTHFATADELDDDGFFAAQLRAFSDWTRDVLAVQPGLLVHAANSAATLREPLAQFDMVRCGIGIYGMDPFGEDPAARRLEPALELCSYVAEVKPMRAGESTGYGRRFVAERDTSIGILPVGYGDGWRRALSDNADVLIAGRRFPLVGTVSMDSVAVDLGAGEEMLGESAVLIGSQLGTRITAEEVARRLGTINYEVSCALTPRVTRVYHRDGAVETAIGASADRMRASGEQ
jgi:alanine racemase